MTTYLVGYDLRSPGKDYSDLIEHLKTYLTWWHHLDSTWLVVTTDSAQTIRDACLAFMDGNDKILVARVSADGAWSGIAESGSDWLQSNL